jgi:hypothetical protein
MLLSAAAIAEVPAQPQGTLEPPDVDACLARLDPQLDIGYDRIAARCPELMKQLGRGVWAPWLPREWKEPGNDLSAGSLRELRNLVIRESAAKISGRGPEVHALRAVLSGLEVKQPDGWWSRFKSWLRSKLETREQAADESWLARMVSHVGVPQSLRQFIAYGALAAVVVLAMVIVVNELRAAGLLPRARAYSRRRASVQPTARDKAWNDIERALLLDKPRLLLELIVKRLGERGLLPPAGALTVRELTRVARLPEPDDRSRLAEVAGAAERVRYAARALGTTALERSVTRGRELLDRLDASVSS